jgi:hypothetical protein
MLSEQQFYAIYGDYSVLIEKLSSKVVEFQKRNKNTNVDEQLKMIETLQFLQDMFHKLYHTLQLIDGKQGDMYAERKRLMDKINRLEKENSDLKENIQI